ncbi:hypothetical protein DFS34DRAFT_685514 [Phlyctochytrium arcticum]|nr:hypothetical protein DFS34DRAFT_685514 [Phlyctochytrium arcticum]
MAVQQGLYDVVRSLVPASPAEMLVGFDLPKAPSPLCSISTWDEPLWRSAVKRAMDDKDYVILELFIRTLDAMKRPDGIGRHFYFDLLLEPAFIANDHDLLRFFRGIGVPLPTPQISVRCFLTALYHVLHLDPDKCICAKINYHNAVAKDESAHATMESICIYLGVSDPDWDIETSDPDEVQPAGMLFVPPSNKSTEISCQRFPRMTANNTNLFFNRHGHAMCRDCLQDKFKKAKQARSRETSDDNEVPDDDANIDNIRVGSNTAKRILIWNRIFLITPNLAGFLCVL